MNNALILCDAAPAASAPAGNAAAGQGGLMGGLGGPLVPMLLILALFYVMMIRPQQRKEKERRKMIEELRAGAKIVFAGGLMGTIVSAGEKTFTVAIASGAEIEIMRSCVQGVVTDGAEEKK